MEDVRTHVGLRRVSEVVPARCGTWAVAVVSELDAEEGAYRRALWRVDLETPGAPVRLTRGPSEAHTPRFRSDGTLAFLSNRPREKGDDLEAPGAVQVWAFPSTGGEPEPLTDEPLGVTDFRFARQAEVLVLWTARLPDVDEDAWRETAVRRGKQGPSGQRYTSMPVRFWDHWRPEARPVLVVHDAAGRRLLTPDAVAEYEHVAWDVAPDGTWAVLTHHEVGPDRITDSRLDRIDLASGERTVLVAEPRSQLLFPFISPDATQVTYARHRRVDGHYPYFEAAVVGADGQGARVLAEDWDLAGHPHGWLDDHTTLLLVAQDGQCAVHALDVETGERVRRTHQAAWAGIEATRGGRIVGLRSDLLHPPEVHVLEPDGTVRCPATLAGEGSLADRVAWSSHRTCVDDGSEVQWFLVRPRGRDEVLPGLIWVHGGPISSWQDTWHWRWNSALFALEGYALCLPNPRGSTGFGHDFAQGIWNNAWGGACYQDVMAVTADFVARDDVDADRVGLMGGSFGGYMANQVGATTDRFRCLVSHAGLFDFTAFYGATDFPAWWGWQLGCDPYSDRDRFERWSPSRGLSRWKTPTLVVHGERDFRVPVGEALALFEGLQLHGVASELLIYPDEGHWILKPENIVSWHQHIFRFLADHLRPETSDGRG